MIGIKKGLLFLFIEFCFLIIFIFLRINLTSSNSGDNIIKESEDFTIVKIDKESPRFFVVIETNLITQIEKLEKIIQVIYLKFNQEYNLNNKDWNISFFSSEKYAGYKSEKKIIKYLKSGDWAKNYLGEFTNKNKELTIFPLLPNKRKMHKINYKQIF